MRLAYNKKSACGFSCIALDLLFVFIGIVFFVAIIYYGQRAINIVVAEGVFERVEYTYNGGSTVIYFVDGSTIFIGRQSLSVPFKKNTRIRIIQESKYKYVVKRADE